jgi:hypothetical protein
VPAEKAAATRLAVRVQVRLQEAEKDKAATPAAAAPAEAVKGAAKEAVRDSTAVARDMAANPEARTAEKARPRDLLEAVTRAAEPILLGIVLAVEEKFVG